MSWWIAPSLLAIFIKLYLLFAKRIQLRENGALEMLLIGFLGMNLVELAGFLAIGNDSLLFSLLTLYYIFCTLTATALLNLFMQMNAASSAMLAVNWVIGGLMAAAFLVPNAMLIGIEHLGFSVTRVPGPYYMYWGVYASSALLFAMVQIGNVYIKHRGEEQGKQVLVILLGLLPAVVTAIAVMLLMQLGYRLNAGVVLSLMICSFLLSLIWAENKHSIFKVLSRVPNTEEHRIRTQLQSAFASIEMNAYSGGEIGDGLASSLRELEKSYKQLTGEVSRHGSLIRAEAGSRDQSSGGWMMY